MEIFCYNSLLFLSRFCGWFALRGVLIFPEIQRPELMRREPEVVLR
jgi:hypothetical protein